MNDRRKVIFCQNVWKIFGQKPDLALKLAKNNATRQEIKEQTGQVLAVKNASFEVYENEIFVIMGLSGSGKSTIVRCINRLIEPTQGHVYVDNEDITRMNQSKLRDLRRQKLSMVFQNFGLIPHYTVLENIAFGLELRGEKRKTRTRKAMEVLEQVELKGWENSRIDELSGGMQQRVGLARSLAMDTEIVLMDEPFSALDPLIRRQMQDEFLKIKNTVKKTIVFITHDLVEALKLGNRIAIMKDGEIVQIGTPQEIVSQPADNYVSEFVKDIPRAKLISAESIMEQPQAIIWGNYDSDVALREMSEKHTTLAFVTDTQYRLIGVVTMKQVIETARDGIVTLNQIAQHEIPMVSPSSTAEDILNVIGDGRIPVAVLDDKKHLLGVVTPKTLFNAIKSEQGYGS